MARLERVGLYTISIDVRVCCRRAIRLLCTQAEALQALATWTVFTSGQATQKPLNAPRARSDAPRRISLFFRLPLEIREQIYRFAIPTRNVGIRDVQLFGRQTFLSALGDPTGFSFPLGREPMLLQTNRQIRHEALPIAYQHTRFILDDMDDLMKLLVAVGEVGRDNIVSLELSWTSRSETASRLQEESNAGSDEASLPAMYASSCVELLHSCRRLRSVKVRIERDALGGKQEPLWTTDSGLNHLVTLDQTQTIELVDADDEPLALRIVAKDGLGAGQATYS
jgi:hypothetical protein